MDYQMVTAVLDYRSAERAKEAFNRQDKEQGFEELQDNPHLLNVLAWMRRAQDGRDLDTGKLHATDEVGDLTKEGLAIADEYRETTEDAE